MMGIIRGVWSLPWVAWLAGCSCSCFLPADQVGATWPLYPQAEAQSKPLKGGKDIKQGHEPWPKSAL